MPVANLADAFRLSPLQEGGLSHHIRHPKDDAGLVQLVLSLSGPLSPPSLQQAWEQAMAQYPILRTSFRWAGLREPFQLVNRRVALPWEVRDWRGRKPDPFLAEDRARRLDPAREPLLRLSLLQTGDEEHTLVWTWHRLLLDRRSALWIAGRVLALYEALVRGESRDLEPSRSLREVVEGMPREDPAETERFWRRELARTGAPAARKGELRERAAHLPPAVTAALDTLAREAQIPTETLAQGAWALLLAGQRPPEEKSAEVIFGVTVDAGLAEPALGPLSQTLPLRVTLAPEAPLLPWLLGLRDRQAALRRHGQVPLDQVEKWAGRTPLFDSQVVDETLPEVLAVRPGASVEIREMRLIEPFQTPLTLAVRSGPELALRLIYDRTVFAEPEIAHRLERLASLLEAFAGDPRLPVRQLLEGAGAAPRRPAAEDKGASWTEIRPVPRNQPIPATFFQEWALQLDFVEINCIPYALLIDGRIDVAALRRAVAEIMRYHEALRTSFLWEEGEVRQVIAPTAGKPLPVVDISAIPEPRRTDLMYRLTSELADHVFDIARGPLFLYQLIRMGERQHALVLNLHHAISDGWSLQVLQRDLFQVYRAFADKRPSPLPPLAFQPADYAWWQRRVYAVEGLGEQLAWWRRTLTPLPPSPSLPIDHPRTGDLGLQTLHADLRLPAGPTQALRTLAAAVKASVSMVLLAATNVMLFSYSGEDDQVLTTTFAGRNRRELSGLVGLFLNMLPIRTDLSGNPTFRDLTARVRAMMVEAYARQDVSFSCVLADLFPGRKLVRTLISGVCFNMLSFPASGTGQMPAGSRPGDVLSIRQYFNPWEYARYELAVAGQETDTELLIGLTGAASLFQQERLADMAERLKGILLEASRDPDTPLDRLRLKVGSQAAYSI
jgi:non-ribosomal peptide synthetase component F